MEGAVGLMQRLVSTKSVSSWMTDTDYLLFDQVYSY